jgi:hypothetical protein
MPSNTNQSAESAIDTSHSKIDKRLKNHFNPTPIGFYEAGRRPAMENGVR